jgi:hypothetical protein
MNLLAAAFKALDDAKVAGRPRHDLDQLEATYRDARHRATDQLDAHRRMVERLPTSTWLAGHNITEDHQ